MRLLVAMALLLAHAGPAWSGPVVTASDPASGATALSGPAAGKPTDLLHDDWVAEEAATPALRPLIDQAESEMARLPYRPRSPSWIRSGADQQLDESRRQRDEAARAARTREVFSGPTADPLRRAEVDTDTSTGTPRAQADDARGSGPSPLPRTLQIVGLFGLLVVATVVALVRRPRTSRSRRRKARGTHAGNAAPERKRHRHSRHHRRDGQGPGSHGPAESADARPPAPPRGRPQ